MRMLMEILWKSRKETKLGSEVDGSWAEQKQAKLIGGGAVLEWQEDVREKKKSR